MTERARILVVDDDEGIRKLLTKILEEEGYVVDAVKNGREAIEKSKIFFYNLALVDFRLPDMDGTDLLTGMSETTPKMVKIILTGYPSLQNAIDAVNKGADGYLVKPVDVDILHDTMRKHLKRQEEARVYTEEKIAEFIETKAKELGHVPRPH